MGLVSGRRVNNERQNRLTLLFGSA